MLIVLLSFLLLSCGHQESKSGLNTKVHFASVPQLDFTPSTSTTRYFEYFSANVQMDGIDENLQFCQCSRLRDKITISIYDWGGLSSNLLTIEVADSSFISKFKHTSDVKDLDATAGAIEQELTLNKLNPAAGDTLSGHISFIGLSISGFMQEPVNRVKMNGNFSCVVKKE